jgi:hypothetical protein
VNTLLQNADITVANREGLRFIDERQRFQQRQFTYGSFESGGRLKGGFWSGMSKAERFERIRINGEDVVELDYHGMLPHLLYGKAGLHAPVGDPYAVPGLMIGSRSGIKKLFAALVFDRNLNRSKFPKGTSIYFTEADQQKGCKAVIKCILNHHQSIAHLFGKGLGHHLQWQESQLMVSLLIRVREWGFIGLPVHDCLIVPRSQAFDVQTLMENVAMEQLKVQIPVKKKVAQCPE